MSRQEPASADQDPAAIRRAAMDLLARREHSRMELRNKLRRRFSPAELIDEQLQRLADENLQSDVRFAESYLRQRIGRGYGPLRLRQELRERGLGEADCRRALDEVEVDWFRQAGEVLHKKFGDRAAADIRERARRVRFMQYRGFSEDQFRHLI